MSDDQSPVAVLEAPEASNVDAAPSPATEQATSDAPEQKAPEAPQAPDYKSLAEQVLGSPDGKKFLLEHPEIAKEMKHRVESVRKADVEREVQSRLEAYKQQAEAERQREAERLHKQGRIQSLEQKLSEFDDPTHPLAQETRSLVNEEKQKLANEEWQAYQAKMRRQVATEAGDYWLNMLTAQVQTDESLSDDEKKDLNPRDPKWETPDDFFKAWRKASTSNEAKKMAKELAKVEAEAIVETRLGEKRAQSHAPANLPPGEGTGSDKEFMADYAAGKSNDHARAMRLLKN